MKKLILGLVAASAVAIAAPGLASADASNNGTTNDMKGYATANHIHNFNDGFNGIGHLRSEMTGSQVAAQGGHRVANVDPATETGQGTWDQWSNNG